MACHAQISNICFHLRYLNSQLCLYNPLEKKWANLLLEQANISSQLGTIEGSSFLLKIWTDLFNLKHYVNLFWLNMFSRLMMSCSSCQIKLKWLMACDLHCCWGLSINHQLWLTYTILHNCQRNIRLLFIIVLLSKSNLKWKSFAECMVQQLRTISKFTISFLNVNRISNRFQ